MTAVLLAALTLPALAQDASPPPPIVNGSTTSDFKAVGALLACHGRGCSAFCSGTLIASKWVLTAGHCVQGMDGYTIYFAVGRDVYDNITDYAEAKRLIPHSSYNSSTLANDIGLVELKTAITSVTPYQLNRNTVNSSWVNKELTYVGYGITTDSGWDSGYKRYAEMPVVDYDNYFIYSLDTADAQNLCSGDSGGAALEPVGSGYELAGVNSFVFAYSSSRTTCEGGGAGVTRVDKYVSWIESYADLSSSGDGGGAGDGGAGDGGAGDGGAGDGGAGDGGAGDGGAGDGGSGTDTGHDTPQRPDEAEDKEDAGLLGCSALPPMVSPSLTLGLVGLAARRRRVR